MSDGENKSLIIAGDEEYHSSTFVENDFTGGSRFPFEGT